MSKWENELLRYLQNANDELRLKKQYFFKIRNLFEYLYKMTNQKRFIETQINLLEKLNISSNKFNQKLCEIENEIKQVRKELNMS